MTYERFGILDSALYFASKSYEMQDSAKLKQRGDLSALLGDIYSRLGETEKALGYFRQGIDFCKRDDITKDLMTTYNGLSRAFRRAGETDSSIYYAKQTLLAGRETQYRLGMLDAANLLANTYASLNKTDSAFRYMRIWADQKDSSFNDQQLLNVERMSFNDQLRQQELANKQERAAANLKLDGILIIFFIALLTAALLVRNITLRRKNERLIFEKTNARLIQEAKELEMQALRSQMNPHFIFNCLNAINRFILKSDPQTASDYLTKFARLMRMTLSHSQQSVIPLDEELTMLTLYIDMERLRFKDSFNYSIQIVDRFDTASVFIPPLLLQPFVENAIWHGLMHKKGSGRLFIILWLEEKWLKCAIEDNGIGRARAAELKSKSAETKKSMGIGIGRNRLALFNNTQDPGSSIRIIDLKGAAGNPEGTRVELTISARSTSIQPASRAPETSITTSIP